MTTRFKEDDLTEGLTGAIHETGHALYEQGRNLDYDGLPVNQVPLLGNSPGLKGITRRHDCKAQRGSEGCMMFGVPAMSSALPSRFL